MLMFNDEQRCIKIDRAHNQLVCHSVTEHVNRALMALYERITVVSRESDHVDENMDYRALIQIRIGTNVLSST